MSAGGKPGERVMGTRNTLGQIKNLTWFFNLNGIVMFLKTEIEDILHL